MKKGVSTFIAFALTILFLTFAVVLVMTIVTPTLDRAKESGVVIEAFSNLELIDSAIKEVASEAQGSKRTISLTVSGGDYRVDKDKEWIYFEFDAKTDLGLGGGRGDIKIETGLAFLDFFNQYLENSNGTPTWSPTGNWSVENQEYSGNGTSSSKINDLTFSDGTFETRFNIKTSGSVFGIKFRGSDATNSYYVKINTTSGNIALHNATAQIASAIFSPALNTWYKLKIEAIGTSIKVYIDAEQKISATDSSYTSGSYNALVTDSSDSHVHFDDIRVTTGKKDIKLIIPYSRIDLNGTDRFSTGNHQIEIENMGLNTTTNKPIINIRKV
jgi:hypothetical protein